MKFRRGLFLGLATILGASVSFAGDCGCGNAASSAHVASGCGSAAGNGVVGGGVVGGEAGAAGCGAQITYVERTVMVPTQVTEKRSVNKTVYSTEERERRYNVTKRVPRTETKTETYTVQVTKTETKKVDYTVQSPITKQVKDS